MEGCPSRAFTAGHHFSWACVRVRPDHVLDHVRYHGSLVVVRSQPRLLRPRLSCSARSSHFSVEHGLAFLRFRIFAGALVARGKRYQLYVPLLFLEDALEGAAVAFVQEACATLVLIARTQAFCRCGSRIRPLKAS